MSQPQESESVAPPRKQMRWWLGMVALPVLGLMGSLAYPTKHWGQPADPRAEKLSEAGSWLAWSMLGLLTVLCGLTVAWVFHLRRLARNPDPALVLLDEIYQSELTQRHGKKNVSLQDPQDERIARAEQGESPLQGWEKPGDWWKKDAPGA